MKSFAFLKQNDKMFCLILLYFMVLPNLSFSFVYRQGCRSWYVKRSARATTSNRAYAEEARTSYWPRLGINNINLLNCLLHGEFVNKKEPFIFYLETASKSLVKNRKVIRFWIWNIWRLRNGRAFQSTPNAPSFIENWSNNRRPYMLIDQK
jgi:hypothetical protein